MKFKQVNHFSVNDDLRQVSYSEGRVLVCGGNSPSSGSRSAYSSKVQCRKPTGEIIWEWARVKSWPFLMQCLGTSKVACVCPTNFSREPSGIQLFDIETGTPESLIPIEVIIEVDYSIQSSDFRCIALLDGKTRLIKVSEHGGNAVIDWQMPDHVDFVLDGLFVNDDHALITRVLDDGKLSIEMWKIGSIRNQWSLISKNSTLQRHGDLVLCCSDESKRVDVIDTDRGVVSRSISLPSIPFSNLIVSQNHIVWGDDSRALYATPLNGGRSTELARIEVENPGAFYLNCERDSSIISVLCVTDYKRPTSDVSSFEFNP